MLRRLAAGAIQTTADGKPRTIAVAKNVTYTLVPPAGGTGRCQIDAWKATVTLDRPSPTAAR